MIFSCFYHLCRSLFGNLEGVVFVSFFLFALAKMLLAVATKVLSIGDASDRFLAPNGSSNTVERMKVFYLLTAEFFDSLSKFSGK